MKRAKKSTARSRPSDREKKLAKIKELQRRLDDPKEDTLSLVVDTVAVLDDGFKRLVDFANQLKKKRSKAGQRPRARKAVSRG